MDDPYYVSEVRQKGDSRVWKKIARNENDETAKREKEDRSTKLENPEGLHPGNWSRSFSHVERRTELSFFGEWVAGGMEEIQAGERNRGRERLGFLVRCFFVLTCSRWGEIHTQLNFSVLRVVIVEVWNERILDFNGRSGGDSGRSRGGYSIDEGKRWRAIPVEWPPSAFSSPAGDVPDVHGLCIFRLPPRSKTTRQWFCRDEHRPCRRGRSETRSSAL